MCAFGVFHAPPFCSLPSDIVYWRCWAMQGRLSCFTWTFKIHRHVNRPDNCYCVCRSVFENAIDMAHIHYLHNDTFGNQGQPQIRHMTCSTEPYGVTAKFGLHNKPVNAMWEFSKVTPYLRKAHLPLL